MHILDAGLLPLGLLASASLASASLLQARQTGSNFSLYAYGPGLGGFPVFYADGLAYTGDALSSNASETVSIYITSASDGTWTAHPNTSVTTNATWTDKIFYVDSSTHAVGFADSGSTPSGAITTGFSFYGRFATHSARGGNLEDLFTATRSGTSRVWALTWNTTTEANSDIVPVSLRSTAPSRPPPGPRPQGL